MKSPRVKKLALSAVEASKSQRVVGAVNSFLLAGIVIPLTLCLFVSSSLLLATTLKKLSPEEMTRASNRIVQAKCLSVESRMEEGRVFTYATFEVTETLAGEETTPRSPEAFAPTDRGKGRGTRTVVVRQLGGRLGNLHAVVPGAPVLAPGQEAILFLERDPNAPDAFMVVGLSQGHMRILKEPATGRRLVRQSTLGAGIYDPRTKKVKAGTARQVPLDDFKRELRRMLERVQPQGR